MCECVCVWGDIITETTLSVFSGKEKYLLTGRTEEKVSSKKLNLLCHKHGYLISAFLLLFDLNFWHSVSPHRQWVTHSLNFFLKRFVRLYSESRMMVLFFSFTGVTFWLVNVVSPQTKKFILNLRNRRRLKCFNPLCPCFSLQTKLQWLMLRRCRRPTSPPQDRVSLIKTPWGPWCWRYL